MPTVKLGLIGLGNIGRHHAGYLLAGQVPDVELTAVCATTPSKVEAYTAGGVSGYTDARELIRSGQVDAVLIATPHYQHAELGILALEKGLHVMVEKPIAAHKADAEKLLACAMKFPNQVFAGMFQLRVEPRYARLRTLLSSGELGTLQRWNWINSDWFRTDAYYASSDWRATWRGEGGGVLLNQCLHNLDVLAWLLGMPKRLRGFCQIGRWHDIEVEDQVTAYFEHDGGANGVFVSSTGEAPGTNRLELVGTRGRVVLENQKLQFTRNESDALEWSRTAQIGFSKPPVWNCEIPFEDAGNQHAILMRNFAGAILRQEPLIAPGAEGLHSVELANAIVYSSLENRTLDLPMDGAAWESKLRELVAQSTHQKQVRNVSTEDFAASFRR